MRCSDFRSSMGHFGWITFQSGMAAGILLRMAKVKPRGFDTRRTQPFSSIFPDNSHKISLGTAGNLAAKGKIPYAILTLMDVLRTHPGQVSCFTTPCPPRHSFYICFCQSEQE